MSLDLYTVRGTSGVEAGVWAYVPDTADHLGISVDGLLWLAKTLGAQVKMFGTHRFVEVTTLAYSESWKTLLLARRARESQGQLFADDEGAPYDERGCNTGHRYVHD